jgi:ABC-2 type transport system ATP-binding protein
MSGATPATALDVRDLRMRYGTKDVLNGVTFTAGLSKSANAKIETLSGGQRRRLDVAIGIVGRPEIVFFDEPTAGFDPHARRDFHDLIHRLSDFENTTILMTTHDLDEAEKISDRILVLDEGRIVADGSADQLARELTTAAEVRWTCGGRRHVHVEREGDPTGFVRDLLTQNEDVTELEVCRASLEDTYMALVRRVESGQSRGGGKPGEAAVKKNEVQA